MISEPCHKHDKTALRQKFRRERAALMTPERLVRDQSINSAIIEFIRSSGISALGAYIAFDGEPSLQPTLDFALERDCIIALPAIVDESGKAVIEFRQWQRDCEMQSNQFGIPEPCGSPRVPATDLDLVLIPLVGWDAAGRRLGMGAGFYDHLFQGRVHSVRPARAGVAYDLQQYPRLPSDPWDVPLHRIFTESGHRTFNHEEKK